MFGAGQFGADARFGEQLDTPSIQYVPVPPPAAILLDGLVRDAVLDPLGRWKGMDPDDQKVVLSFMVRRKSIKHAPEVGNDFHELPPISGSGLQVAAEQMAAAATPFDSLLASGAAALLGVDVRRPKTGETLVLVKYKKRGETRVRSITVGTP